ncbi:hypothetical protein KK083_26980 [Fulvivirgaceae bacterium PWU4]|uniref:Outer membrane protein transport protein (OMPP1/FadL/TodX) n=1 Tax=Chryseosolibacter histidini TaxID=2782349 RepID=A0AAP2DST3_9BACT|nr:hypothetical protein [Chryseosolibacter histidini]MBT1700562.1 hypothetical protein [Chryseosolibacter histidini]
MSRKIFRIALTALVLLNFSVAFAQDYAETALLFSRTRPAGSARIQALGGSQIALGGDYSSGLSNPAGLGMFNRSEFTFSTGLSSHNTSANYFGNSTDDNRTVFNIPGLSLVWHMPKDNGAFLGGSFGISFSRINDFNNATLYSGKNDDSSIIDYFIDQAFGQTTDQFKEGGRHYNSPTGLAYYNYLIGAKSILDPPGPNDEYFTDAGYPDKQQEEILVKGASNQWTFSYGANISDRFFFGAGVGIASIRYKSQKTFTEDFLPGNPNDQDTLYYLQLNENLDIRGSGVNATFGAIARPLDFLQIGVSFVTPTFYSISETYSASMGTRWDNFDYFGDGKEILGDNVNDPDRPHTDVVTSDYNLTTPLKFNAGVAFISKYGFISGDIEMVNPAKAKYTSDTPGITYTDENGSIRRNYEPVINYHIGAEFRYEIYRVRAGYGVLANTYRNNITSNNQITSISGGVGIRTKDFSIDFALVNSSSKRYDYQPYTFFDGSGPAASLKNRSMMGMLTFGFTIE